jgi:hypothetical protein
MANPGGVDFNTSPYYDDFDEDKKFVRVLYRPGRAVQARELTQAQTLQQTQTKRFAEFFFKQGAIVEGCEQNLDLSLNFVKLQNTYNGSEANVAAFNGSIVFGANSGIKAYCGIVTDLDGTDPKTLFINYATNGTQVLTVNNAPTTLVPGNKIIFSTGNTATIEAAYIDPITGTNKIFVSNVSGTLTTTTANTVTSTSSTLVVNVTNITSYTSNTAFANSETIFTANTSTRAYAIAAATNATRNVVDEGLATQTIYNYGSKITVANGVIWMADHFVKHTNQTILLDKYSNVPSYKIGLVPTKSFVDYIADNSLVDNAQGTPNYQAPGADRFKIDSILTKVALGATTDENEFITVTEVEEGITRKRKITTVDNNLEDVMAKRTNEESGNYTISDPIVTVREHLLTGTNGGRYTSAEGGNNTLLLVEVDPFTSYTSGYRNEIIARTPIDVQKGLATSYVDQTKTQINYGQYILVNELVGAWDLMESTQIDLYDTAQQVITNGTHSTATVTGTKIGTARVRSIEYLSGSKGQPDARYYLYIYEIVMNSGKNFKDVRSIYDFGTPKRFADIADVTPYGAVLQETGFNSMIFKLPYQAVKTIRSDVGNVETAFRFKKKFTVSFTSGVSTIATDVVTETFVGTGTLNSTQKNDYYMVVVNNAGANVETTALTGTVTIGAGSNTVTGSATSFTTQVSVGDFIKVNSLTKQIASITNATSLVLTSTHATGATSNTFTKVLPAGTILALGTNGGKGSTRTVTVSSPGTASIDLQENATFTADIIVSMDRASAKEKIKTLNYATQANIQPNTHISGLAGPFGLGYGDIYQLRAVYQSSSFLASASTSNTNVTSYFTLDNGQRDYGYEHGSIKPITGFTPTGRLLAVFDNFTHDTSQGVGYLSVDSYPVNDVTTSNTTITTSQIPIFTSPITKTTYNLRDCIDFRPIKTANTSLNAIDDGTYQVPTYGLRIPQSGSDFSASLIYYKGRISKVYINNRGVFGINDGVPPSAGNQKAESPPTKPDTLELAELTIPPYPSNPIDVKIKLLKNKRFTMRDVAKLNDRVEKLEYFTALNFLEKQATDTTQLDDNGFDRFKNGIIVDPFSGFAVSNPVSSDWAAAIDRTNRFATALQDNANTSGMRYNGTLSETTHTTGNKIMLPYTEVEAPGLKQPYASAQIRLAEELNFVWQGELIAVPHVDNFFETTNDTSKAIVYNDTGDADNWKALVNAWNSEVAPLNVHWIGNSLQKNIDTATAQTTQVGNFNVTTAIQNTTQIAYNQLASGSSATSSKQDVAFDRVVKVETALWMRQREFAIRATGLKNNARIYAFFDGVNVTSNCYQIQLLSNTTFQQLNSKYDNSGYLTEQGTTWLAIADGSTQSLTVKNNEIYLLFRVPYRKFYVGQREFLVTDSPTNSAGTTLTSAKTTIFAQGIQQSTGSVTINSRPYNVSFNGDTNITLLGRRTINQERVEIGRQVVPPPVNVWAGTGVDPLSQSFYVDPQTYPKGFYTTSVDLYFRTKSRDDNRNVRVEIREVDNGYPSPKFVGIGDEAVVNNKDINISEDASASTKFTFKNPIFLASGNDYAFTMRPENNDADYAVWVAELGAIDVTNPDKNTRIESAYNSGVLFSSSNDRTHTARQNLDVKFTMRVAEFSTSSKVAYWTNIPISTAFQYDVLTPMIGDQVLPGTNITYDIKTADSAYSVDGSYTTIKNYEKLTNRSRKQISANTAEDANSFKSLQLRATLSTNDKYISPYIDNENILFNFSKNIINNAYYTPITGTIKYTTDTAVVGVGTDFSNTVYAGEYADFGVEYRRIASVTNSTYLTVTSAFTTSNVANQTMSIRNEEHPTGPYSSQSRYITKVVTLNDGFEASDVVVYLDVNRPPGTSIKVYVKVLNENDSDSFDDKFYTPLELSGTETFTLDQTDFKEEKYVVPMSIKTGGSTMLVGNVAISNVSTTVTGTSTRFIEDLKIGDTIAVGANRTNRIVTTISNNISLTVDSAFSTVATSQDIFKVLNNSIAYTTPDGRTFQGYKYFAIKVVFLSSNPNYATRIKNLRGIALA